MFQSVLSKYPAAYFILGAVTLMAAPYSAFGQGGISNLEHILGTKEVAKPETPPAKETAEERLARLKIELLEAQIAALEAGKEVDLEAPVASSENIEIPTGALVIIKTDNGGGSGFVAEIKGRKFLVTNIHVLAMGYEATFTTTEGETVNLSDSVFASFNRDLAIVPIEWDGPYLEIAPTLKDASVSIGDAITVMGNSDGVDVATRLEGKINGIGPDKLEISAKFVPGNSGSPIVHNATGKVIGLVSYMMDLSDKTKWTKDSELSDIRRFGFRIDGDINWQSFTIKEFYRQGEIFNRFEDRTTVLANTSHMLRNERKVMTGYRDHETIGYLFENFDENFDWSRGTRSAYNLARIERFINGLGNELQGDRNETKNALSVEYFKRQFTDLDAVRVYHMRQLKNFNP